MLKHFKEPFQHKRIPLELNGEFTKGKKPKSENIGATLKRIWSYLAYNKGLLYLVLFMVVISSAMGLLGPYLVGMAIDDYIVTKNSDGFIALLIWLGVIYVLNSLALWFQNYWMIGIAQETVFTMRTKLFGHLHRLPIPFFDKRQQGN